MPVALRIVQNGLIDISPTEGIKDSRPTSSLLVFEDFRLLIDTEHPKNDRNEYAAALARRGVVGGDIHAVVLTHLHPDHMGHKEMFPKAVFVFHADERLGSYFNDVKTMRLTGDALVVLTPQGVLSPQYTTEEPDLCGLDDRLWIKHIPGHTQGSLAVFAWIDNRVHAFVGDTFLTKEHFDRWEPPGSSWRRDDVFAHMEFIRQRADVVVPGHGELFRVVR